MQIVPLYRDRDIVRDWNLGMLDGTDRDISTSMLRLWGQDAAQVALGYAGHHEVLGNETVAARWHTVRGMVVETQRAIANAAKRTRDQDFTAVTPGLPVR